MSVLELGLLAGAITAVLVLAGLLLKAVRWLHRIAIRVEQVLERADQMPEVLTAITELRSEAVAAGKTAEKVARLKRDLDQLWERHRALSAEVAAITSAAA